MKLERRCVAIAGMAWSLLVVAGCGVSVGPSAGAMLGKDGAWVAGPAVGYRTWPGNSRGLIVGGDVALRGARCCWDVAGNGAIGYGVLPLPHTSSIGFEAAVLPGIARRKEHGERSHSFVWGWQLAVPIRVSPSRAPWEQSELGEPIHLLVPSVRLNHWVPFHGEPSDVRHEISMGISYRFHFWPAVKP